MTLILAAKTRDWERTGEQGASGSAARVLIAFCRREVILKLFFAAPALLLLAAPATAAPIGPDAPRCQSGGPALLVSLRGLKSRDGLVRVWLYGANPSDFLKKGRKMHRVELRPSATAMDVCLAVPGPGRYAVAVRHDTNGDRDSDMGDGGGFSRNPRISLVKLKPSYKDVAFNVGPGVHRVPVVMQYRRGLSIGPLRQSG